MKVALLTFHNAANYGASLQAYALEKFLIDNGINCEYINYVNYSRAHEYSMTWHIYDSLKQGNIKSAVAYLLGSPFMALRKRRFKKYYTQYLKVTPNVYRNSQEAAVLNEQYDFFVVGSDQVWNPSCNGDDAAFLLDFVKEDKKRISYSPSFGLSEIDSAHKALFSEQLGHFKSIGVRETVGQKIVKELTGRDATLVLDPVLLLTNLSFAIICTKKSRPAA